MKLKQLTITIFLLLTYAIYAQDTIYFDKHEAEIDNQKKARFYRIIRRDSLDKNLAKATDYFKSGKIKTIANLVDESSVPAKEKKSGLHAFLLSKDGKTKWLNNGKYMEWFKNGKLKKDIDFRNGGMNNQLITYWPNGRVKRREQYDNSWKMLRGVCYESDGLLGQFLPYFQFPVYDFKAFGSMQTFINKNLQYPKALSDKQCTGKMSIHSFIDSNGEFYKNTITKGIHPELDNAVNKLLSRLPNCFAPAMCNGDPTSYRLVSSVIFCKPIYTENLFRNPSGKDTIYYDKDGFIQKDRKGAVKIELLSTNSGNTNELIQSVFYQSGKVMSSSTIDKNLSIEKLKKKYDNLNSNSSIPVRTEFNQNRVLNGKSMNWYENGQLKSELNYISNKMDGEQIYYTEDGTITNRAVFENGKLISGNRPEAKESTDVEIMPQFPGGESAMFQYLS